MTTTSARSTSAAPALSARAALSSQVDHTTTLTAILTVLSRLRTLAHPRKLRTLLSSFYAEPVAWLMLVVSTVMLTYAGGLVLFYLHAIVLHEGGPAIAPWQHWLVDSTVGFIGLSPAIFVIIPVAAYAAMAPSPEAVADHLSATRYAATGGTLFALVTAPGPLVHDALVGRGTWVANEITKWWGHGRAPNAASEIPKSLDMALQVMVGLPVYVTLVWVTFVLVRRLVRLTDGRPSGR